MFLLNQKINNNQSLGKKFTIQNVSIKSKTGLSAVPTEAHLQYKMFLLNQIEFTLTL